MGTMAFDSPSSYTIAGPGALTLGFSGYSAQLFVAQGSHSITAATSLTSDTDVEVASGASLTLTNLSSTTHSIRKAGNGTLAVNNLQADSLNIAAGTVQLSTALPSGHANTLNSLTLAGAPGHWLSTLDIGNSKLTIHYGSGASPDATVRSMLISGRNGGTWDGTGIDSSIAATHSNRAVGYIDNGSGDEIIRYTLLGDTNLDGSVDTTDAGNAVSFYGMTSGARWWQGDFDYNGTVDVADWGDLSSNYGGGLGTGNGMSGSDMTAVASTTVGAAVPEPSGLALLAVGAMGLMRRRRA
jgi:hypothetical protein